MSWLRTLARISRSISSSSSSSRNTFPHSISTSPGFSSAASAGLGPTLAGEEKPRLLVVGSGWAGCRLMKGVDAGMYDIVCVSPRNHMVFTPLLASTCVGTLEFRSVAEPIGRIQPSISTAPGSNFFLARCTAIDPDSHTVHCETVSDHGTARDAHEPWKFKVSYDKLVIATGAEASTFGIRGVKEHAIFLREVHHAQEIRRRLLLNLMLSDVPGISEDEKKRLLHCLVIGGGPTGVEFSGELSDFIIKDVHERYSHVKDYINVTLIEVSDCSSLFQSSGLTLANEILSSFDVRLRQYATNQLTKSGVRLVRGLVKDVQPEKVVLSDGTEVPYGLLVWSTGVGPSSLVKSLGFPKSPEGRIGVDEWLRVPSVQDVFAIGDCSGFLEGTGRTTLPALAQVAERQGKYLCALLNRMGKAGGSYANTAANVDLGDPFVYKHLGSMATVGRYKALVDLRQSKMEPQASHSSQIIGISIDKSGDESSIARKKICGGTACGFSDSTSDSRDAKERFASMRKLLIAVILCAIFMAVEVVGGIKANSLAILTDATHLLSDVAAFAISLFSIWASGWEATPRQSYGFFRIEILGALVSIQLIWLLTGILLYEAIARLIHDTGEVQGLLMFSVATFGLLVNIIMAVLLGHEHGHGMHNHSHGGHEDSNNEHGHDHDHDEHGHSHSGTHSNHDDDNHDYRQETGHDHSCEGGNVIRQSPRANAGDSDELDPLRHESEKSLVSSKHVKGKTRNINVHSAYLHVLGDSIQSVGVMIGGAIIWWKPEWKLIDMVCTLFFSVIVLITTIKMLRDILEVLMESTPRQINATKLEEGLCQLDGVVAIHELHIWAITVGKVLLACHVMIAPEADAELILDMVIGFINREYNISHVTIQIERQSM
ncbi:hypothetical protein ZIOFF_004360 [Zingiber officinale]|uniref:Uncharacterized protein n=2 Tax=Zingiber officinale TaxID=94328 RepID=A0A8J5MAT9_ZINOF|nr:hypothetical protein ZIOFF_004360 [Zingiber officinale]